MADKFGIRELHDEKCTGTELCRACFLVKYREALQTAEAARRPLMAVGNSSEVKVYMPEREPNPEIVFFVRTRQGIAAKIRELMEKRP